MCRCQIQLLVIITKGLAMETEFIDKLFLELSQITKAKTRNELILQKVAYSLKCALENIIEECPKPKLPYGMKVVEIAKEALKLKDIPKGYHDVEEFYAE